MNLKDRIPSGSNEEEQKKTENSNENNLPNITEKLSQLPPEQDLILKQSEAIQKLQKELSEQTTLDQEEKQILSSEKSDLTSAIAALREELSSTQKINRSLVQENDDLRNHRGLITRKEVRNLEAEVKTVRLQNAELMAMVDKSSVDAVDKANEALKKALMERDRGIREAQDEARREIWTKRSELQRAEDSVRKAKEVFQKKTRLYFGLLAFTLVCCCAVNDQVIADLKDLFKTTFTGLFQMVRKFTGWLSTPTFTGDDGKTVAFGTGPAWTARILALLLIIVALIGITAGTAVIVKKYRSRWCTLSVKVLAASLAVVGAFGELIRSVVPVNLVILFALVQIGYLITLLYLDGYFESKGKSDVWRRLQEG